MILLPGMTPQEPSDYPQFDTFQQLNGSGFLARFTLQGVDFFAKGETLEVAEQRAREFYDRKRKEPKR